MNRPLVAVLLSLAAAAILAPPASAVTIHQHRTVQVGDHFRVVERVVRLAPADSDDDGCPDSADSYDGPGCKAPAPSPASPVSGGVAGSAPAIQSEAPAPGGTLAAIRQCESGGSYTALNPSGAGGAYQIMPSTWAGLGYSGLPQDAPAAEQDAAAAKLYAEQGTAPWVSSEGCWG